MSGIAPEITLGMKLAEELGKHGVKGILGPWNVRRLGRAAAEVRRHEMLLLAQTELDIKDIRAGRKRLDEKGNLVLNAPAADPVPLTLIGQEGSPHRPLLTGEDEQASSSPQILQAAAAGHRHLEEADSALRGIHVQKAVLFAEEALEHQQHANPSEGIDDDWMQRWRRGAEEVSREDLQRMWGRVLAGEFVQPGTFHPRTLDFMSKLTVRDAQRLERLGPLVVFRNSIARIGLESEGISLMDIVDFEGMGILTQAETKTLEAQFTLANHPALGTQCGDAFMVVRRTPISPMTFQFPTYPLTPIGAEILSLGQFKASRPYLERLAGHIRAQNFQVDLHFPEDPSVVPAASRPLKNQP